MENEIKISRYVSISRFLALLSIISAHVILETSELQIFYGNIGLVGVAVFLFLSGVYYSYGKIDNKLKFLKGKAIRILIPTIVAGAIIYIYIMLVSRTSFSMLSMIAFIFGYKTYLYFSSILFIIMSFLSIFKSKKWLFIFILVNIISVLLTQLGLLESTIQFLHLTNYLNVFNWIGFFSLGIFVRQYILKEFLFFIEKFRIMNILFFSSVLIMLVYFEKALTYFSISGIIFELASIIVVFSISSIGKSIYKYIKKLEKYVFPVYLYHMPIIGVIYKITGIQSTLLTCIATFILVLLSHVIAKKIKVERYYKVIIGIK